MNKISVNRKTSGETGILEIQERKEIMERDSEKRR